MTEPLFATPLTDQEVGVRSYAIEVDAEMAKKFLKRNKRNRNLSNSIVQRYRNDMAEGRWQYTGDPIRFSDTGKLLDGQHRLTALSELPDVKIRMMMIWGLPEESQMVMDQGRKRTAAQQLTLAGIKNAPLVAAGVKLHLTRILGFLFRGNLADTITTSAIEEWVSDNHEIVKNLPVQYGHNVGDATPSVGYAAALAFYDIDAEMCSEFFYLLSEGSGVGNPINALDKRLQRDRRRGIRTIQREQLGMFFMTWNNWVDGRTVTKLQKPKGGFTAENFPELIR